MDWSPLGDSAWLCQVSGPSARDRTLHLHAAIREAEWRHITDVVISFESLAVYFTPENGESVRSSLKQLDPLAIASAGGRARLIEIPTDYHHAGSEIDHVAARLKLTGGEVVKRHISPLYEVAAIGFSPGFPYLTGLDPSLFLPRKNSPSRVPRGAVAMAGSQAGIYPNESPGGWHVLGITQETLFSPESGSLLRPGDRVKFVPTTLPSSPLQVPTRPERIGKNPTIEVIDPGPFSSIQDLGRPGYRSDGVSPGGCLDPVIHSVANHLVGNPASCAAIECSGAGPVLKFLQASTVAWCGWADESGRPHRFQPGDLLDLRTRMRTATGTIAFSGGIDVPAILGSRATDIRAKFGGLDGRRLQAGDVLSVGPVSGPAPRCGSWHVGWPEAPPSLEIRFLPGIQSTWFSESSLEDFRISSFTKSSQFDRTGMRLEGPKLKLQTTREMQSQPVACGSIQVPPDGSPIILLAECQTIGGYPQIGHVISADLPRLARALPGTRICFREVDLPTARAAWRTEQRHLAMLKAGLFLKT